MASRQIGLWGLHQLENGYNILHLFQLVDNGQTLKALKAPTSNVVEVADAWPDIIQQSYGKPGCQWLKGFKILGKVEA